jgi:hypothetical protein
MFSLAAIGCAYWYGHQLSLRKAHEQIAEAVRGRWKRRNIRDRRWMQHRSVAREPRAMARAFGLAVLRHPGQLAASVRADGVDGEIGAAAVDEEQRRVARVGRAHHHEAARIRQLGYQRERHGQDPAGRCRHHLVARRFDATRASREHAADSRRTDEKSKQLSSRLRGHDQKVRTVKPAAAAVSVL